MMKVLASCSPESDTNPKKSLIGVMVKKPKPVSVIAAMMLMRLASNGRASEERTQRPVIEKIIEVRLNDAEKVAFAASVDSVKKTCAEAKLI